MWELFQQIMNSLNDFEYVFYLKVNKMDQIKKRLHNSLRQF